MPARVYLTELFTGMIMKRMAGILSGIILFLVSQVLPVRHFQGWTENPGWTENSVQVRTFIRTNDAQGMLLLENADEDNPGEMQNQFLRVCIGEEFLNNNEKDPCLGFTLNFLPDPLLIDRPPPAVV